MAQMAALANGQLTEIHPTVSVSQPGGLSRKEGASLPAGLGRCLLPTRWRGARQEHRPESGRETRAARRLRPHQRRQVGMLAPSCPNMTPFQEMNM